MHTAPVFEEQELNQRPVSLSDGRINRRILGQWHCSTDLRQEGYFFFCWPRLVSKLKGVHAVLGSLKQNVSMIRSKERPQASAGMEIAKAFQQFFPRFVFNLLFTCFWH